MGSSTLLQFLLLLFPRSFFFSFSVYLFYFYLCTRTYTFTSQNYRKWFRNRYRSSFLYFQGKFYVPFYIFRYFCYSQSDYVYLIYRVPIPIESGKKLYKLLICTAVAGGLSIKVICSPLPKKKIK